jgi:hypothetical protein
MLEEAFTVEAASMVAAAVILEGAEAAVTTEH